MPKKPKKKSPLMRLIERDKKICARPDDTRPIEKREKPRFSMKWNRMKELLGLD